MPWIVIGLVGLFGYFALKDSGAGASGAAPAPNQNPPWSLLPDTAARSEMVLAAQALLQNYQALACAGLDASRVERFQRAVNAYAASAGKNRQLNEDGLYDEATDAWLGKVFGVRLSGCSSRPAPLAGGGVYSTPSGGANAWPMTSEASTYAQPNAPTYAVPNAPGSPTYSPPLPPQPAPGTPQTATQTTAPAVQQQTTPTPPAAGPAGVPVSGFGSPIEAGRTSERFRYT